METVSGRLAVLLRERGVGRGYGVSALAVDPFPRALGARDPELVQTPGEESAALMARAEASSPAGPAAVRPAGRGPGARRAGGAAVRHLAEVSV
ncbi:thiamine pyrophosphate-binding protein [Streptomyces sp. NPDC006658]|uniref:thiamine pyrophosphate-binding protein n=1 Tax=Streptomyces sp. NPDC006658 TaxID=3156900 RepID=UPI0034095E90